jgi:hypothetical protein
MTSGIAKKLHMRDPSNRLIGNVEQELKNHVAAGDLKKGATKHLSDKPSLATWTLPLRLLGSTCSSASTTEADWPPWPSGRVSFPQLDGHLEKVYIP